MCDRMQMYNIVKMQESSGVETQQAAFEGLKRVKWFHNLGKAFYEATIESHHSQKSVHRF
jgi:hypothetical protein